MLEETEQISKTTSVQSGSGESRVGSVSVRGIICMLVFGTVCFREVVIVLYAVAISAQPEKIQEPFYGLVLLTAGYYFGQKNQATQSTQTTTTI